VSILNLLRFGRKNRLESLVVSFPNPLLMQPQHNLYATHSIAQVEVFLKEHLTKAYDRIEENAELFNF